MASLGILHLTTFLQGGAGRAIADLACAQRAAGHRVTVVTSETAHGEFGNYQEYLDRLQAADVALHVCDSLFSRDLALNMQVLEFLRAAIDLQAVDIVHAHAAVPAFIGGLFIGGERSRVPLIQTQHGWGINKTPEQAAFDLDILRQVDRVITTSQATADLLAVRGTPVETMSVIPCGLASDEEEELPPEAAAVEARRAAGQKVVGCIGSVTLNKNQLLLLHALQSVDAGVVAVFLGEGSERLLERAMEMGVEGRVIACGYQPHASRWLRLFDLLVVPSLTEGQGLVVIEAFRAGVPVVASDIPAMLELIDDGRTGWLFEGESASSLAAAMRRGLSATPWGRHAIVLAAKERFETQFTIEAMVARHEALYAAVRQPAKSELF
jgi:glycosyltransferase involved in cell wall biosynthesis